MSGLVTKALSIPDDSSLGNLLADFCTERTPLDGTHSCIHVGGDCFDVVGSPQHLHEESLLLLQAHALAYTSAASLKYHILQRQVIRTWNGQMTNLKLCLSPEFQTVGAALTRILIGAGAVMRYGAPPKSPLERNVNQALQHAARH